MATDAAPVTGEVLKWARLAVNVSPEEAARRAGVSVERLLAWEAGRQEPTLAKLRSLAKLYQRPIAVFFLDKPPREFDAMRDFRRIPDSEMSSWSRPLHKVYRRAIEQQEIMAELLAADGADSLSDIPTATRGEDPDTVAARARAALGVNLATQHRWRQPEEALRGWIEAVEGLGVLVLRTSDVNTAEMRGFSMPGDVPVMMLNATDPPRAQAFTALHELAHLMLNAEGICDLVGPSSGESRQVEAWCNAVAAAILMPRAAFLAGLGQLAESRRDWDEEIIGQLSDRWSVSREAVTRRLVSLNLAPAAFYAAKREEYQAAYESWREEEKQRRRRKSGGPPPYRMTVRDRGKPYVRLVLDAYQRNELSAASSSRLLELRTRHFPALEREVS